MHKSSSNYAVQFAMKKMTMHAWLTASKSFNCCLISEKAIGYSLYYKHKSHTVHVWPGP